MTLKIAVLSGRPKDGTLLPKKEQYVWNELVRVIKQDLTQFKGLDVEFLIPIYTKFDLEVLRIIEHLGIPAIYYIPTEDWGTKRLPKHQLSLIERMRKEQVVVPGATQRIDKMIQDSDVVYCLPETDQFSLFSNQLQNKLTVSVSTKNMLYYTEEEGQSYMDNIKMNSLVDTDAVESWLSSIT